MKISDFKYNAIGTTFTAVPTDVIKRSTDELDKEREISLYKSDKRGDIVDISKEAKELNEAKFVYKTKAHWADSTNILFTDSTSGKYALVTLKNDTIDALKEHFGESDFYQREDGAIRLNNEAEAYVSGCLVILLTKGSI
jgi:hypothetical protein